MSKVTVTLTRPQLDVLADAARYWETVLEDQVYEGGWPNAQRDMATLERATRVLFDAREGK